MLPHHELFFRLCLSALLGSIIGFERERLMWAAGIRTHMLVCVGACLIMIISAFSFFDILGTPNVILDPSRMAAQVVSGIGFLGAGAILLRGEVVRGLTTAASIWIVAGIGLAVGGGLYLAGIATTFIIIIILVVIKPFEDRYKSKRTVYVLKFKTIHGQMSIDMLKQIMGERSRHIEQFSIEPSESPEYDNVCITLSKVSKKAGMEFIEMLREMPCLKSRDISIKFSQIT